MAGNAFASDLQLLYEERNLNHSRDEDDEDESETANLGGPATEDLELRNLLRSVPKQFDGIAFESCFNQSDFNVLGVKLYTLTQRRDQWDNPETWSQNGFTFDHRLDYARDLCDFWYLTCHRQRKEDVAKFNTRTLHFYLPWLRRATNRPHGEVMYRIVLCAHECLRRSHDIACQPYDSLSAGDFKAELRRVQRTVALMTYLRTVILPTWTDYDWSGEDGMCCNAVKLQSLLSWLNALMFFMSGTVAMCTARGIRFPDEIKEDADHRNTTAPQVLARMMSRGLLSEADTCRSQATHTLSDLHDLAHRAAQAVSGRDEAYDATFQASAGMQRSIMESDRAPDLVIAAAAAFRSAANFILDQPKSREVRWTHDEQVAVTCAGQICEAIVHDTRVAMPSQLELPTSKAEQKAWSLSVGDDLCEDWAAQPWWNRLTGLSLRCLGDYYLSLCNKKECRNRAHNRVLAALCHVVALTEYGTNVLTPENLSRMALDPDDMNRRVPLEPVSSNRKGKVTVDFTFLNDLEQSYMHPFLSSSVNGGGDDDDDSAEDEESWEGPLHIPWSEINRPMLKASPHLVARIEAKVREVLPTPETVERVRAPVAH